MRLARLIPAAVLLAAAGCSDDDLRTQPEPVVLQADLVAEAVVAPAAAPAGGVVQYEVGLSNGGGARVDEGWYIRVYLSEDRVLDGEDMLVDQFATRRALGPGATDSYARAFKLPGAVVPGAYHLVSELDATGVVEEPIEDNNAAASGRRTAVQAPETEL